MTGLTKFVFLAGFDHVGECNDICHDQAQEKESHNLAVKVERLRSILQYISQCMTHIYSHRYLILHHLHELPECGILLRRYQVILSAIIVPIIVAIIIYHVRDQTNIS